jgi:acyl-CoA synthetase (AMP-forming)/AMP-acid ligase II
MTTTVFARKQIYTEANLSPLTIGELLDSSAERYADRVLWESIDDGSTISYAEFRKFVNGAALALYRHGVRRESHVAVMLPNIPAYAVTWLALSRLGAVLVPINTRSTSRELNYFIENSASSFLVIDRKYQEIWNEAKEKTSGQMRSDPIWVSDNESEKWWRHAVDNFDYDDADSITPTSLMSIQYTSGSTGMPKGCMLTHDYWGLLARVRALQGEPAARVMIDKPMSYMGGMWRFLMCLTQGSTACVAVSFTLSGLHSRLVENNINYFSATDAVANLPDDQSIKSLEISWISAAGLSKNLQRKLEERFRAPVREMFGMTEAGAVLYVPIEASEMTGSGSCGIPVPFRECKIVDPSTGNEVPSGTVGELWVRGRAIMLGYFENREATSNTLVDGWLRTGDLFSQDERGFYYIRGRIKDSIRRSGENIASREVETVAAGIPGVRECAVVGVPDALRGQEVKLCLVLQTPADAARATPAEVIRHCADALAAFKVPRYIEYYEDFPRTKSGKIAKLELIDLGDNVFDRTSQ